MNELDRRRPGRLGRLGALIALLLATACLHQDTNSGVIIHASARPTASASPSGSYVIGQRAGRPNGNTVAVLAFAGPFTSSTQGVLVAAADVEGCVNPNASRALRFAAQTFQIEMSDKTRRPSTSGDEKSPAFTDTAVKPGRCQRGWVHFEYRSDEKPAYVVYEVTPPIRWKVG